ncbi:MAG TPA: DUF6132 family protein [bacterium]|nr:DUF6132 family protein [bacterium]HPN43261.1 DUF6132 family protein [bacterium]
MKKIYRILLGVIIGGALGFAYYYFIGCKSGACPITGNPWISTLYGAGMGVLFTMPGTPKKAGSSQNS